MNNFKNNYNEIYKFIKFVIVILISSAVNFVLFMLLLKFVFSHLSSVAIGDGEFWGLLGIKSYGSLYSLIISSIAGYTLAYYLNRKFTFNSNVSWFYSASLFTVTAIFNIFVCSCICATYSQFALEEEFGSSSSNTVLMLLIINIVFLWEYPLERFAIHIRKKIKKAVAVDLDGTLLNNNNTVSPENIKAIEHLYEQGVETIIVTGRTYSEIPKEIIQCKYIDKIVFSDGAVISSKTHGNICTNYIDEHLAKSLLFTLKKFDVFVELYSNGTPYVDFNKFNDENLNHYNIDKTYLKEIKRSRVPSRLFPSQIERLEMLDVFFADISQKDSCIALLKRKFPNINITSSMDNNIEITSYGASKGKGLQILCDYYEIDRKNIIALGDSNNDLSMFKESGKGFAVSNACNQLKHEADRVICSNDENVICYMEKFIDEQRNLFFKYGSQ